jgi:hypothetical protein
MQSFVFYKIPHQHSGKFAASLGKTPKLSKKMFQIKDLCTLRVRSKPRRRTKMEKSNCKRLQFFRELTHSGK